MSTHPHLPAGGHCLRNVHRDFVEWHRGRSRYVLWAIDVNLPVVQLRIDAAKAHLDGLLLDGYVRQPHITLALCGFPGTAPLLSDEFGAAVLERQIAALQQSPVEPFDILIGELSSFASAPYLSVTDHSGGIEHIRACLDAGSDAGSDTHAYTPHVTVGLYADAWPTDSVRPRLTAFAPCPAVPLRVTQIGLFAYAPPCIGGRLEPLASYDLVEKRLQRHGTALFAPEA